MLGGFLGVVVLFVAIYYFLKPKRPKGFPPGPENYPIVGGTLSLSNLGETSGLKLMKFGEIYGPIGGLWLGKTPGAIVTNFEIAKEVFNREDFAHRPPLYQFDYVYGGKALGVFFSNGHLWREQRRFTLRTLRDFGFGKSSMESLIHEEAAECIKSVKLALKESGNSRTTVHDKFGVSVVNILWATMSGQRFSHQDAKFQTILNVIQESFRSGNSTGSLLADYMWLRHIPPFNKEFDAFIKGFYTVQNLLKESVEEHKKTRDPNYSRDFIDVYLKEMEEEELKGNKDSTFFDLQLMQTCADLFNAGAESTSNTIAFALLYMLLYPEVQEKVHAELDSVVGKDRFPGVEDKAKLNYVEAVLAECYRMNPIAPVSVPHFNIEKAELAGYTIPKGTVILVSILSIHMDKKYWGDPEVFRPERHLDSSGKFVKPERVVAFGFGKRGCVGESLARMSTLFLFSTFMQQFKLGLVPGEPRPSTIPEDGFTTAPKPFEAILTSRV